MSCPLNVYADVRVEREQVKEGLRVWLERKAKQIRARRREGSSVGVGVLVWRFSRRSKASALAEQACNHEAKDDVQQGRVSGLRRFWEGLGDATAVP
ncbi:hypothetical protein LTR28_003936 [Elasticomyces elasticus]|nr:hypothetical protein LTR28_003936 [Elasticomyces elasticus]